MTISTIRYGEPLYVIIVRDPQASSMFKSWMQSNRVQHAQIQDNKMNLFDYHSINLFMVTWTHWDNVVIWDAWNRCHIHQNR